MAEEDSIPAPDLSWMDGLLKMSWVFVRVYLQYYMCMCMYSEKKSRLLFLKGQQSDYTD